MVINKKRMRQMQKLEKRKYDILATYGAEKKTMIPENCFAGRLNLI